MKQQFAKLNIVALTVLLSATAVAQVNKAPNFGKNPLNNPVTTKADKFQKELIPQKTGDLKSSVLKAMEGGIHGGGGDASEMGVDQIRADILNWIKKGGALAFKELPNGHTHETYFQRMSLILQPHAVAIGFVTTEQEQRTTDPELRVWVDGRPKQCRSFLSRKDRKPRILCNLERYPKDGAEQYRLIHHEYAGLVGVEKNEGSSSDYALSSQLSDFLVPELVYRLAVTVDTQAYIDDMNASAGKECSSLGANVNFTNDIDLILHRSDYKISRQDFDWRKYNIVNRALTCKVSSPAGEEIVELPFRKNSGACFSGALKTIQGIYLKTENPKGDEVRSIQVINAKNHEVLYFIEMDQKALSGNLGIIMPDKQKLKINCVLTNLENGSYTRFK